MWANILVPAASYLLGISSLALFQRVTHTNRPVFSRESGRDARNSINLTKAIFNKSAQEGGWLAHPWEVDGILWNEGTVQEQIAASRAEINDRKLSGFLDEISKQIREMFAAGYRGSPQVFVLEHVETERDRREAPIREKFASLQLTASDLGLLAVSGAMTRLDKISRNL